MQVGEEIRPKTHVVRITIGVTPLNDLIAPPFTSKIVKSIVEKLNLFPNIRKLRMPYKPLSISPLYAGGEALFKEAGSGGMLILRSGITYVAHVAALLGASELDDSILPGPRTLKTPYGEMFVEPLEISIAELGSLSLGFSQEFKIKYLTPLVLSNKQMMPPNFPARKRIPSMHKLLPSSSYIFSYLARLWNRNVDPRMAVPKPGGGEWAAYKIGRVADLTLVEINYELKPVTVIYDKKNGRFREVRGTVGWIHYKLLHPKPKPVFAKLLALANYMGVGRSRGIGMGQVRVEPLD